MHCCLTGFLPGFSGCYPGETQKALSPETQSLTSSRGGCSGSSGFSGSSGDIKECGSELFYYHWLYGRYFATRARPRLYPIISLVAHPEEPEEPEQPRYPEQDARLSWPERELVRQLAAKLFGRRSEGGR